MKTWIALFRGINVGGNNILPMKELAAELKKLGLNGVRTYIQSGNVVFRSAHKKAPALAERIGGAVNDSHGFEPRVMVLAAEELETAVAANPFPEAGAEPKTLHVYFLDKAPSNPDIDSMNATRSASEEFALKDKVFYLHAPDGIGRSKLAERVEKLLGVVATARNWRTVSKVLEMTREISHT